jgi:hypothetical protein
MLDRQLLTKQSNTYLFITKINIQNSLKEHMPFIARYDKIITKLSKIMSENIQKAVYITGSILNQTLFDHDEGNDFKIIPKNQGIVRSLLKNNCNERILFDGEHIYVTAVWFKHHQNKTKLIDIRNITNEQYIYKNRILLQKCLLYYFLNNLCVDSMHTACCIANYSKNDYELVDDGDILRYMFKHMNLETDIHLRHIIYLIINKPEIILVKYDSKNIIMMLLEEQTFGSEHYDKLYKLIFYFIKLEPELVFYRDQYLRNILFYCKTPTELSVILKTGIAENENDIDIDGNTYMQYRYMAQITV